MIELVDQMNVTIRLEEIPKRIVSLVPSQTELLYDFGLMNEVVGITKFCIHPKVWFENKTRIGGTKSLNIELIKELKPDLIIGNKEENSEVDIIELRKYFPVYMSDIFTLTDAVEMIHDVGTITGKIELAENYCGNIIQDFSVLQKLPCTVLYLIWSNPYMAVGSNTFIGNMMSQNGFTNCIQDKSARYLELTDKEIANLNPDFIFLSSEPFPFNYKHKDELSKITESKIEFVDGELFSWYGTRMLKMKEYFSTLQLRLKDNL